MDYGNGAFVMHIWESMFNSAFGNPRGIQNPKLKILPPIESERCVRLIATLRNAHPKVGTARFGSKIKMRTLRFLCF